MTARQILVLEFIQTYVRIKGFPPSLQDIAVGLGLKSRSNIHRIVHVLEEKGLLAIEPRKVRTLKVRERSVEKMLAV